MKNLLIIAAVLFASSFPAYNSADAEVRVVVNRPFVYRPYRPVVPYYVPYYRPYNPYYPTYYRWYSGPDGRYYYEYHNQNGRGVVDVGPVHVRW